MPCTGIDITRDDLSPACRSAAIAPDGTWLATAGANDRDGRVLIWDTATGTQTSALTGHVGGVTAVAIAPDGTWLAALIATGHEGTVQIWDKASAQVVAMMRTDGAPLACAWTADGVGLIVGGNEGVYFYEFSPDALRA